MPTIQCNWLNYIRGKNMCLNNYNKETKKYKQVKYLRSINYYENWTKFVEKTETQIFFSLQYNKIII